MTIAFVNGSEGNYLAGTSRIASLPSGLSNGQMVVMKFALNGTFTSGAGKLTTSTPGWSSILAPVATTVNPFTVAMFIAQFSATLTNPTVTWDGSNQSSDWQMAAFSGVDTTTPIDVTPGTNIQNTADTHPQSPSINTVTNGAMLLHCKDWWAGGTYTEPTGFTQAAVDNVGGLISYLTQATAGPTGTATGTCTTATVWLCSMVALRPYIAPPVGKAGIWGNAIA